MSPRLFITGVTGYIGGDFLYLVSERHPDWDITCLVRNSDKGAKVAATYPKVRLVYGDLDAVELIEEEASKADIVYHFADADHIAAAQAIAKGLTRRPQGQNGSSGYWIHTSGTGVLLPGIPSPDELGEPSEKVFDDWDNLSELTSLPDYAPHRNVDKIVLAAGSETLKTAIVCPPTIYGPGRGPDNQRSIQLYRALDAFLSTKHGFQVGKGQNTWHYVHVQDLSELYLLLGEAAALNGGKPATWNDQGYYLAEAGSFVWGELLTKATEIAYAKGYLASGETRHLPPQDVEALFPMGSFLVGSNSRGVSQRGKILLGWKPSKATIWDELPAAIDSEAARSGLVPTHKDAVTA